VAIQNKKLPIAVYAESTPNPASMKFVANKLLVQGPSIEFTNSAETAQSPLAQKLFQLPFVTGVFISGNFVTVTKSDVVGWDEVALELREMIQSYLSEGGTVLNSQENDDPNLKNEQPTPGTSIETDAKIETEEDKQIVQILDEYIRPGVEQDGGAIHFKSFKDGVVTVVLKGACSGCPSSTVTLKSGMENVLKRLVPEVKEVIAEEL